MLTHTNKTELQTRPLQDKNGISFEFEDMLENLTILLDDDGCGATASTAYLPTYSDAVSLLKTPLYNQKPKLMTCVQQSQEDHEYE